MSESRNNPKAIKAKAGEIVARNEMMTVIVSEITLRPVAERYPITVAISEMAEWFGVDANEEAVVRAMQSDANHKFRPNKTGSLMMVDPAPADWDGNMESVPHPEWASDENELELAGGPLPIRNRVLDVVEAVTREELLGGTRP